MAITTLNLRALNRSDTASSGQVVTATSATAMDFQAAAGGLVLGIQQTVVTGTLGPLTNTSFANLSGMAVAITPTKASSKILLTGTINAYWEGVSGLQFQIEEDVDGGGYSPIPYLGDAAGSRTRASFFEYWGSGNHKNYVISWNYLHTPTYTLTDVLTYQIQNRLQSASDYMYLNRTFDDADNNSYARGASTMQAWEID